MKKENIKNPVKIKYTMNNSDINVVGDKLGYDWNEICDEIDKYGCSGQDGDGFIEIFKMTDKNRFHERYGEILGTILFTIFEMNPLVDSIYVMNDF